MARIIPQGWREIAATGAAQREIETLSLLAETLPDAYTVYHAVHWTNVDRHYAVFGEIDFVVVNRAGDMLLIEQKSGFMNETADGLVKQYPGRSKNVPAQISRMVGAIRTKLAARQDTAGVHVDALLYCPDYHVRQPQTAGIDPARIVDADRREHLGEIIRSILPEREPGLATQAAHRFLRDIIRLEPDVSAILGHARELVTRVSGGLAHWARQLDFHPHRLHVVGTAGAGKTQLALAEYRAVLESGGRPLYVCFNRPLADHFARIAPAGGTACTVHQLCAMRLRQAGEKLDFSGGDAFDALFERAARLPSDPAYCFDAVIVDEGQDFSSAWRDFVFSHAAQDARLTWMEDPLQNLYGRPSVDLPGWVTLHARSNYRSPRPVVRMLQSLLPDCADIEAASPFAADEIEVLTYRDTAGLHDAVKQAIRHCYMAGFKNNDLAVVSYHGRDNSRLMNLDRLGSHGIRRFTGEYDLFGQPVYSEGEVFVESVYRFKGQAAPAIVFAEVDFETLDEKAARKLLVGATRAMMKLVIVAHERSAQALLEKLG